MYIINATKNAKEIGLEIELTLILQSHSLKSLSYSTTKAVVRNEKAIEKSYGRRGKIVRMNYAVEAGGNLLKLTFLLNGLRSKLKEVDNRDIPDFIKMSWNP